jgi:hypothetical protein
MRDRRAALEAAPNIYIAEVPRFSLQFDPRCIEPLADEFAYPEEDRVAAAAGRRACERGYYTREDARIVYRWKARRSEGRFVVVDGRTVRKTTRRAFAASDEAERIELMTSLPGVGVPVASALLHFAFPDVYPILDVRALESLGVKGRSVYPPSFWVQYVSFYRALAAELGVSLRTLDAALWQYSKAAGGLPGRSDVRPE